MTDPCSTIAALRAGGHLARTEREVPRSIDELVNHSIVRSFEHLGLDAGEIAHRCRG